MKTGRDRTEAYTEHHTGFVREEMIIEWSKFRF